MVIDWQHHYCPPELLRLRGRKPLPAGTPIRNAQGQVLSHSVPELFDIEAHLRFMDAAGIDKAVISMAGSITHEETGVINDAYAALVKKWPDRFVALASCVPCKAEQSVRELERAIGGLGLSGVCIDYSVDGHALDSKALWPFYDCASQLGVPVFVHIAGTRPGFEGLQSSDFNLWTTLGTMVVDQTATVRVILSGVMTDFPDLQLVIAHMGGGIAANKDRFTKYLKLWGERIWTELGGTPPAKEPLDEYFEACFARMYFDLAGYEGGMNALRCALVSIAPSRLLFGTDYPFNFTDIPGEVRQYVANIRAIGLSQEATEGVLAGNAARLLRL